MSVTTSETAEVLQLPCKWMRYKNSQQFRVVFTLCSFDCVCNTYAALDCVSLDHDAAQVGLLLRHVSRLAVRQMARTCTTTTCYRLGTHCCSTMLGTGCFCSATQVLYLG